MNTDLLSRVTASIIPSLKAKDWFVTFDLQDLYVHKDVYPSHRMHLRVTATSHLTFHKDKVKPDSSFIATGSLIEMEFYTLIYLFSS